MAYDSQSSVPMSMALESVPSGINVSSTLPVPPKMIGDTSLGVESMRHHVMCGDTPADMSSGSLVSLGAYNSSNPGPSGSPLG